MSSQTDKSDCTFVGHCSLLLARSLGGNLPVLGRAVGEGGRGGGGRGDFNFVTGYPKLIKQSHKQLHHEEDVLLSAQG